MTRVLSYSDLINEFSGAVREVVKGSSIKISPQRRGKEVLILRPATSDVPPERVLRESDAWPKLRTLFEDVRTNCQPIRIGVGLVDIKYVEIAPI